MSDSRPAPATPWWRVVPWPTWLLLAAAFAGVVVAIWLEKEPFAPDTRYYAAMALRRIGTSAPDIVAQVRAYDDRFGWPTPIPGTLLGWDLVQPRVVYPLLSAPFVALFGIPGMQVVPIAAFGLAVVAMQWLGSRLAGVTSALFVVLLVLLSRQVVFYSTAMLTEGIAMALIAGIALTLPWRGRRRSAAALATAVVLTVVLAFTRQTTLIPAGAVFVAWAGAWVATGRARNAWAPFAAWLTATAVGTQVLQSLLWPNFSQLKQFLDKTGTDSLPAAILASPRLAWHIVETDLIAMAKVDRALLALVVLAVVAAVVRWRHTDAHLLMGALAAGMFYNVTNGTPTMFRYTMPGMVFLVVCIAAFVTSITRGTWPVPDWPRRRPASAVDPGPADDEVEHGVDPDRERLGQEQPQPR